MQVVSAFKAPRWLGSGHLQTLGAALPLWTRPRHLEAERLWFDLPGGGALHAQAWWHRGEAPRPLALVVHGVAASSDAMSVVRGGRAFYRAGFHVVRLDLRGAGEGVQSAPAVYHAGVTEDPLAAIRALSCDPRVAGIVLVGISLGGHVSLKLAGELGANAPDALRAVATVSAPVDIEASTQAIDRLTNYPYRSYVLRGLVKQWLAFSRVHPDKITFDLGRLRRLRRVRDYHEEVIAKAYGFADASDYHAKATAAPWLRHVEVPTLMVHAEDDPMVPLDTVRPFLADASPRVTFLESATGGHVGWLGGLREEHWVNTWAIDRAIAFARRHV
jgi:predicted alpha/beta-fold hydrolase